MVAKRSAIRSAAAPRLTGPVSLRTPCRFSRQGRMKVTQSIARPNRSSSPLRIGSSRGTPAGWTRSKAALLLLALFPMLLVLGGCEPEEPPVTGRWSLDREELSGFISHPNAPEPGAVTQLLATDPNANLWLDLDPSGSFTLDFDTGESPSVQFTGSWRFRDPILTLYVGQMDEAEVEVDPIHAKYTDPDGLGFVALDRQDVVIPLKKRAF